MTLTGSLNASVGGLVSQGVAISNISTNISNQNTVGYKSGSTFFETLITGGTTGAGGGVSSTSRKNIDQQGLIQGTGVATDIAITGNGFFVVKDSTEVTATTAFTRAGSFRQDERGFFVNSANYILQAWPLDIDGRLPGEIGNLNTTSNQLIESLEPVSTRDISGLAFATTNIALGLNLDAGEDILLGAGDEAKPIDTTSPATYANSDIASDEIIADGTGSNTTITASGVNGAAAGVNDSTLTVDLGSGASFDFVYGGFARSADITGTNMFTAATPEQKFDVADPNLDEDDFFTITSTAIAGGSATFTFKTDAPITDNGEFNSLETLAEAINAVAGLTARVANNQLYVSNEDARISIVLADDAGSDIVEELFGAATITIASTAANRFNTLDGLSDLINEQSGLVASVESSANDASVLINASDPLETITFSESGDGNLLTEFGLAATTFDAAYNLSTLDGRTMASGDIAPSFTRNVRVFDSLGTGHDLRLSFAKIGNNQWIAELYAADISEVVVDTDANPDGILARGQIFFNGDGSLRSVDAALSNAIEVVWANEALSSEFTLDLGTAGRAAGTTGASEIGLTDGLSQFNGPYTVQFVDQNGAGSGQLSSVEIDDEGFIIANFTNGQSRRVYKVPVATFPNVNGLSEIPGNAFVQSDASGEFSLNEAGDPGTGDISPAALEQANVELSDELTKLIVAQRSYQANTRVITTVDELLEELNRI